MTLNYRGQIVDFIVKDNWLTQHDIVVRVQERNSARNEVEIVSDIYHLISEGKLRFDDRGVIYSPKHQDVGRLYQPLEHLLMVKKTFDDQVSAYDDSEGFPQASEETKALAHAVVNFLIAVKEWWRK